MPHENNDEKEFLAPLTDEEMDELIAYQRQVLQSLWANKFAILVGLFGSVGLLALAAKLAAYL